LLKDKSSLPLPLPPSLSHKGCGRIIIRVQERGFSERERGGGGEEREREKEDEERES
jgi:hypothetical protein